MSSPLIVSLTDRGARLGKRLAEALGAEHQHRPQPFKPTIQQAFTAGRRLLLICATGIAVRTLAPVLKDKLNDPAVLVLDEEARFVIPLLSGHEGGANHWADEVANLIQATAVITSARQYRNPVLVAGMGCERNCPEPVLRELLESTLTQRNLTTDDLTAIASIDVKADEIGLIQLAECLGLPFVCYPATDLRSVEGLLQNPSDVVFREVGCYGVAEGASLYHASQLAPTETGANAELLIPKHKNAQATVALARAYSDQDKEDS